MKPSSAALTLAVALGSALVSAPAHADATCIAAYEQTQTLRKDGKPVAARAQAATCARAECPALLTKDCTKWLAELDGLIPSVVLDPRTPAGAPRADVRVKIDGTVVTEKADGKPLPLDPGSHAFVFEAEGATPATRTAAVKEGEKGKKITVTLAPAPEARGEGRPIPLGVWVFGGASVAALAASAVFALDGFGKKSDLEQCKPRCAPGDVDAMSSSFTVADVALGAGIVAGAAALYLFLTRPPSRSDEGTHPSSGSPSRSARPVPFAAPLAGGATMGLTARF